MSIHHQPYFIFSAIFLRQMKKMNKLTYKEMVIKRISYIQILAKQERYNEIQNLLETNFVLVA
jgi:hypothetical protein